MAGTQDIVMIHGANCGAWCFETFRAVFEAEGWTCHAPDLVGHGMSAGTDENAVKGVGMADYRAELEGFLVGFVEPPVLLGHSMGAVLAQQLAAQGLARALILLSPAPRAGILPASDGEKQLATDLMSLGAYWTKALPPSFDLACIYSLNRMKPEQQRSVFDRFVPESGRALFELFFWMFDKERATAVDVKAVRCPVLCLSGTDDRLISLATARATAEGFPGATFWEAEGHAHMLLLEPGADALARRIVAWIPARD